MAPIKKILFLLLLWSSGISSSGVNSASMKALTTQKENWNSRGSCDGNEEVFSFQPDKCACTESCIIHGDCLNGTSCQSGFMGCRCDDACSDYGDCCATASANNLTTMVTAVNNYECVFLPTWGASLYAKGKCSDGWRNATVKNLCQETNANYSSAGKDPLLDTPVVSTANNVIYKNIFCAICNMEPVFNIKLFYSEVTCQFKSVSEVKEFVNISNAYFHENLHFINNNSWSLYIFGTTRIRIRSCTVKPIIPEIFKHKGRYCEKFASTCSYNWTDHQIEKLCHYHTNLVRDSINGDIYRNYYCALCNFVDINDIECYHGPTVVSSTSPKSLSVLFVFNEKKSACDYSSLWDPFTKKCRHVYGQLMDRYQQPINLVDKHVTRADNYSIPESITELALREGNYATCAKMFLNESEFVKGPNLTIYVPAFILTYSANEYELRNDGVYICRHTYTQISRYVSITILNLSCVCLVLHILASTVVPEFANILGKNLVSLCLALLVTYVCMIMVLLKVKITGFNICRYLAFIRFYFFLATFMWMNVIAFDIWRSLSLATSKLIVSSGKQWKKFLLYSLYAWTVPALALIVVVVFDSYEPSFIPPDYLPKLGERFCWFGQRNALLIYLYVPSSLIMTANLTFFVLAVRNMSNHAVSNKQSHKNNSAFTQTKIYIKLALIMGLTWVCGIAGAFVPWVYLSCLLILLTSCHGLYIFFAFTCNSSFFTILKSYNRRLCQMYIRPKLLNNSSLSNSNSNSNS